MSNTESTQPTNGEPVAINPVLIEEMRQNLVVIVNALKQEGILVDFEKDGRPMTCSRNDLEKVKKAEENLKKAKEEQKEEPKKAKSKAKKKK